MLRVVLDTNVIISGAITDHGAPFHILKNWENGDFILIVSEPILQEVERVFHYPRIKVKRHLTDRDIENMLRLLRTYSINVPGDLEIDAIIDDPADIKFIVAALEGDADYIVSGDRHLVSLGSYRQIGIVSPSDFLRILTSR